MKTESIAPNFSLKQIDGKEVELYSLISKGNVVVLAFFTTWCKPCKEEFPQLSELAKKYSNQPVKILLVRSDYVNQSVMTQFRSENKTDVPILIDERKSIEKGTVSKIYGVSQFPTLAIIGKDFKIKYASEEAQKNLIEIVSGRIDDLMREFSQISLLAVFFTGNTNGWIYPWTDKFGVSSGGIAKRAEYFKRMRSFYPDELFLDSGDFLPVRCDLVTAKHIFWFVNNLRYDALSIGDQEIAKGIEFFLDQAEGKKLPFISGNLGFNVSTNTTIVPYKILKIGKCNAGILSVNSDLTFRGYPKEITGKINISPEIETLSKLVQELKPKVDIIILLSHCGHAQDRIIAQSVQGIDIIIGGHDQTLLKQAVRIGSTTIVQAGKDGEYVGKLILLINEKKEVISNEYDLVQLGQDIPEDVEMIKLIKNYETERDISNRQK